LLRRVKRDAVPNEEIGAMAKIKVELQATIRRPLAVVSRQFGDMRHHAHNRVHPDITFTVLSEEGDDCRFLQQVRLLGMLQSDEIVQHRNADGSLSSEVVAGVNQGLRIHQGFSAVGDDTTLVTFRAEAPAAGIKLLLKPLFEMAIRKAVKKGLEEDRADLEERGYGAAAA
jgi:hypothetical protein